jgi:acyl carrier protein
MADETTEQRIAQIIAKQNEALQKQIEQEKTLRDLRGESLRRLSEEQAVLQTQIGKRDLRIF